MLFINPIEEAVQSAKGEVQSANAKYGAMCGTKGNSGTSTSSRALSILQRLDPAESQSKIVGLLT